MERSKQLPYKEPPFCTFQYYGCPGVAAMQNPTAYNHYLNECIMLDCTRKFLRGYTSPDLGVQGANREALYFLERPYVRRGFMDGCEMQVIRNMIDRDYYVYFNMVDIFYIDNILFSGEKHCLHDGLICGYDDNDNTLTIAAYDNKWAFRSFKTSQESFEKALAHGKEQDGYDGFFGMKPLDEKISLNLETITKNLEKYLTLDPFATTFDCPDMICGIVVHDCIRLYLQYLLDGAIPYEKKDRRIMRLIYEHKRCMADRISAVEKLLGLPNSLSDRYSQVVDSADRANTLYNIYRVKRKDELLGIIQKELDFMKSSEYEILPVFLKSIKNRIKEHETF